MDTAAERQRLESELKDIQRWLEHPVARKIFDDNKNGQESLIDTICNLPIDSIEAFFNHFQAIGHLRGLRRARALVDSDIADIQEQLEKYTNE